MEFGSTLSFRSTSTQRIVNFKEVQISEAETLLHGFRSRNLTQEQQDFAYCKT